MSASYYVFNIGVAYRENVDEVMALLKAIAEELRQDAEFAGDILEPLEMSGVERFADSAVIIKCRIKTKPWQTNGSWQTNVANKWVGFNYSVRNSYNRSICDLPALRTAHFPHSSPALPA